MAGKENTKKYKVTYTVVKEHTIEDLLPMVATEYEQMCTYHDKKITDINHVLNYFKMKTGIYIVNADRAYIQKHIIDKEIKDEQ